jgi:hypothetical protein
MITDALWKLLKHHASAKATEPYLGEFVLYAPSLTAAIHAIGGIMARADSVTVYQVHDKSTMGAFFSCSVDLTTVSGHQHSVTVRVYY